MSIVFPRFAACAIVEYAGSRECSLATTERRQDKKPHIAAWTVGCFVSAFSDFLHIADRRCDVPVSHFANDFSVYRTSRTQP
ncbi:MULTISPECIES: hypothetical protein [unclassified Nitrobacter]|uniref:hypothetical protein n=1 Tax=unclassified Nitrobacter TaxID=2620411 RepID=UPI001AC95EE9|nr:MULTISPECIES: hypothetical protein [unclassified Nitrobacter]MBN9147085.1 hypothetical protein [Nitrobacter sp.]